MTRNDLELIHKVEAHQAMRRHQWWSKLLTPWRKCWAAHYRAYNGSLTHMTCGCGREFWRAPDGAYEQQEAPELSGAIA